MGVGEGASIPSLPFGFSRPKFKLWAKIELDPEEQTVLDHYHFDKAVLIDSFQPELSSAAESNSTISRSPTSSMMSSAMCRC